MSAVPHVRCALPTLELPYFFDPTHTALAETAQAFALEALAETDGHGAIDDRCRTLALRLGQRGLLGAVVPHAWGGRPAASPTVVDVRSVCVVREMLAWASPLAEFVFAMQGLGSYPIVLAGSDALRAELLPDVLAGRSISAFAITEEGAGSDVAAMTSTARRDGEVYVLDGRKVFISNAGFAGHYVTFAKTDTSAGSRGISAFVVRPNDPGYRFEGPQTLLAEHPVGTLRFDGLRVPASRRLGAEGEGFKIAMATLDVFRPTVGAAAIGMAKRALDEALARVNERIQFGQSLADFQHTRMALAEMATDLLAARMLVYRAAWHKDKGQDRVTVEAAMAKLAATETAQRVIDRALQLHGASGLVRGHVIESLYREVRALRIYEGTSEIQKLVIGGALVAAERARVG